MISAAPDSYKFDGQLKHVAYFPFHAVDIEKKFSISFTRYVEDGLGDALGKIIRLNSGRHFLLKELLDAPIPRLFAESDETNGTEDGVIDLLHEMGLSQEDCLWSLPEGYDEAACVILREDDNGQRFEVGRFEDRLMARLRMHELSKGGHKQHFWIERLNSEHLLSPE
jgi:hypothetical protein